MAERKLLVWVDEALSECRASIEEGLDHSLSNAPGRVAIARAALDRLERIIKRVEPAVARCRTCPDYVPTRGDCPIQHFKCKNDRGIRYVKQDGSDFCSYHPDNAKREGTGENG